MYWIFWPSKPAHASASNATATQPCPSTELKHQLSMCDVDLLNAFGDQLLAVFDAKSHCVALSPAWETVTGHAPEHCAANGLMGLVHKDYQTKLMHRLASKYERDEPGAKFRCQIRHADKSWGWYDLTVARVLMVLGKPYFLTILRQANGQVQVARELERTKLEAELALKGRSEFLANMSHELRTPLNAIIGFSQMMENQVFGEIKEPRYHDYLSHIQDSGHMLLDRINDLLEISLIDTGRIAINEETIDVTTLVHNVAEIHTHHAFSSRVRMSESLPDYDMLATLDRVKMKQAVSNILLNALENCQAGDEVNIAAEVTSRGELTIRVSDTGKGMTEKQLKNIRAALASEDSFYARDINGIGVGLALAKEYITLHEGSIDIQRGKTRGLIVTLTLPAYRITRKMREREPGPAPKARVKKRLAAH